MNQIEGILLIHKKKDRTSFSLVEQLRRRTHVQKIGHGGTLDPFAEGVMVLFIGKNFTKLSSHFLESDKEYAAKLFLGATSDTFDTTGHMTITSSIEKKPSLKEIENVVARYQGKLMQLPPMFSAKKVMGKKLYHLARKGKEIERPLQEIFIKTQLIHYEYPYLELHFQCSKGTYVRSLAHDIGKDLKTGAYLEALTRTRSGPFHLSDCIQEDAIYDENFDLLPYIKRQWTFTETLHR